MTDLLTTAVEITAYDPSRTNLLRYSRAINDAAAWTGAGGYVTANALAGPDGQVLADEFGATLFGGGPYRVSQAVTVAAANTAFTFSVFAKQSTVPLFLRMEIFGATAANGVQADFDLSAGATANLTNTGTGSGVTATIEPAGSGWWRCRVTGTPTSVVGTSVTVRLWLLDTSYSTTFTPPGGLGGPVTAVYVDRCLLQAGTALGAPVDTVATAGASTRTLYFSSDKLVTGAASVPPHTAFDDRLIAAPNFERRIFGNARVTSGGHATAGVLELGNVDHALSYLLDLGLDGRDVVVRVGTDPETYPATWTTWLTGTIKLVEVTSEKAVLQLADRMAVLDLPLQSSRYAGTNAGAPLSGAEGVATDLKGQPKPLAWGRCYQVPAVLVNTGKLTYQVHDGSVQAIDAVYDKGGALTFAANYANLAALEAAVIAAGSYGTCTALGLFRLGGSPAGRVTADIRGDNAGGYVDRAGAIMRRVLETKCGIATAQIDTAAFTALDTAANYEVGYWIAAEAPRRVVIEAMQASVGAYCVPNRSGLWTTGQLLAPTGSPAQTFTDADFDSIERESTADPGGGIPVWQVTVRYKRYFTDLTSSDLLAVGGSLSEATRNELQQPWRTTTTTDAATQTLHLLATTLDRDTYLTTEADAVAERDRLLALHKERRDYVRLAVPLTATTATLDLGQVVEAVTVALGYSAGRKFRVWGITREEERIIMELWG